MKKDKPEVISSTDVLDSKGFEWETRDCVVRAMAIAAETDYPTAHGWVKKQLKREDREGTYNTALHIDGAAKRNITINNKKFKRIPKLKNPSYTHKPVQYTVGTFSKAFDKGNYFVLVTGHALAIKDGVIYDNQYFILNNNGFRRPIKAAFKLEDIE